MRVPALGILTTVMVLTPLPALAQNYSPGYPVCMQVYRLGGSNIDCSFTSLAQCAASASGRSATCLVNPYFANAQMPGEPTQRQRRAY